METRQVACADGSELFCNPIDRPETERQCFGKGTNCDGAKWFTGPWSLVGNISNETREIRSYESLVAPVEQREWPCRTNMVSVFRVLRNGCPVSRSPLPGKDEQRIRRFTREQLQRFEAGERASMQSDRVLADMVHLGLVEGNSRTRRVNLRSSSGTSILKWHNNTCVVYIVRDFWIKASERYHTCILFKL